MAGITVHRKDRAGGAQDKEVNTWFRINGEPVVTVGDTLAPHGDPPHSPAPKMVEGTSWFRVNGRPVCHAGHKADCGHATTGRSWFQIYEKGERRYILSPSDPCNIEHLLAIMRAQDPPWEKGAILLEKWLNGPANTDKDKAPYDTTSISMDYILTFPYPRYVFDRTLDPADSGFDTETRTPRSLFWLNDNAKRAIGAQLQTRGLLRETPTRFDFVNVEPEKLHDYQIQFRGLSLQGEYIEKAIRQPESAELFDLLSRVDPDEALVLLLLQRFDYEYSDLNDINIALGTYAFYYNVAGTVTPEPDGTHLIQIECVGVYVRDNFDFEGLQYLGHWDVDQHHTTAYLNSALYSSFLHEDVDTAFAVGCKITNESFRNWRSKSGHGYDYYVITDVKKVVTDGPQYAFTFPL